MQRPPTDPPEASRSRPMGGRGECLRRGGSRRQRRAGPVTLEKKMCASQFGDSAPFLRSGVTVGDVRGQICSVIPWGWISHLRAPISVSTRPGFFAGRRICGWRTVRFDSHDVRPDSAKTRRGRGAVVYLQCPGDECSGCWQAWNCRFVQRPEGLRRGPCVQGG